MKLFIVKLIDLFLRLVPGSRLNPDSLESRVRRVTAATHEAVQAAIAQEVATREAVKADAQKAGQASRAVAVAARQRAERFERIAQDV